MADSVLESLAQIVKARATAPADQSYTRQLLDGGRHRCAKKLGEEAVETVIAAIDQSPEALKAEAADLLYHLLVVLECRGVAIGDVLAELASRFKTSGLAEKAARGKS